MINFETVKRAYTGKNGCMCGCLGKYTKPSHAFEEDASGDVNDRSVKIILGKINKAIDWNDPKSIEAHYQEGFDGEHIYYYETETRNLVVYTTEKAHV